MGCVCWIASELDVGDARAIRVLHPGGGTADNQGRGKDVVVYFLAVDQIGQEGHGKPSQFVLGLSDGRHGNLQVLNECDVVKADERQFIRYDNPPLLGGSERGPRDEVRITHDGRRRLATIKEGVSTLVCFVPGRGNPLDHFFGRRDIRLLEST